MSRYEAAALLNACLDRVTEMTDEIKRLVKAFEKELAIVKARVDGLEAKVGELEATQFSTTTKLKGKVRFVQGSSYRGDGFVRFGYLKDVLKMAQMYGNRAFDGYSGYQDRSINKIKDGKSQGTAYYYYRNGGDFGATGTEEAVNNGGGSSSTDFTGFSAPIARQIAFSSTWNGMTPAESQLRTDVGSGDSGLYEFDASTGNTGGQAVADGGQALVVNDVFAYGVTTFDGTPVKQLFTPGKTRGSLYMKDGAKTDNSFALGTVSPDAADNTIATGQVLFSAEGIKPQVGVTNPLKANAFFLRDKYGSTAKLRMQTSKSSSGNWKAKSVLLDRSDYGALINLANKSRKVKAYQYYIAKTNNPSGTNFVGGQTLITKAAGQADPVSLGDISRAYIGTTLTPTVVSGGANATAGQALLTGLRNGSTSSGLVVTPGGFVQNNLIYQGVYNYLIAEYGSLSEQQRNTSYVKNAAQAFVRSLAAYPANKNRVADKNAFTFGHDAQLNFNTSFTGKDVLNFRIRSNTIYGFGKRVNAPFADLAFDGSKPKSAKAKLYLDKLYYRFPVGDWGVIAAGTRAPQSKFTTRGSMYNKDSLLEFFNTAAGVYPSYTGAGAGIQIGQLGGKKSKPKKGTFAFAIGYLASEKQAMNPDSYNYLQYGLMGEDTSFRVPMQLAWKSSNKKWQATLNYAYERGGNAMGKVGTELSSNPFGYKSLMESNQYGVTLAYKWSKQASITAAWGGASISSRYDSTALGIKMTDAGDTAQLNSWMVGFSFKDVFLQGNKAGFAIGGVPTVTSNDSGWGTDKSSPIALETWYQFQVTDNISVTPGVFWISGQRLDNDNAGKYGGKFDNSNGDVWGGIIKTEFKF
jgi:hypothetical protein